jgi:signal transduction histidine kinase
VPLSARLARARTRIRPDAAARLSHLARGLGYLALGLPSALLAVLLFGSLAVPVLTAAERLDDVSSAADAVVSALLLLLGLLLTVALAPWAAAPVAALERRRLRVLTPDAAHELRHREPRPAAARFRERYAQAWREVAAGYLTAIGVTLLVLLALVWALVCLGWITAPLLVAATGSGPVALVVGHADSVLAAVPYTVAGLAGTGLGAVVFARLAHLQADLTRMLVEPRSDVLAARLVEVTRSRSRLADAFAAERRRIERDLHDGAQQQLLVLTLELGLARMDLPADSPAGQSVAKAHEQAKTLLADLRRLIRGIHPQVLTNRGLGAALYELAEFCPLPVGTDIDLPHRPPQAVETAAYFAAAEALANALKHSGADDIRITARLRNGSLTVDVEDNGRGGASFADGTGLTGLADRVAVVDGTLRLSSPAGGPTVVRVEIPCPIPQ